VDQRFGWPIFSIVVVAENRLYTTTTNRLCERPLFCICVISKLQADCEAIHKQHRQNFNLLMGGLVCWGSGTRTKGEKNGKCTSHTETDTEKHCKNKKQTHSQPILWCAVNRHTHIKREKQKEKGSDVEVNECW
jgi:hypothetical protein